VADSASQIVHMTANETIDRITPTRRPNDRVVMRQTWQSLLFLHWRIAPEAIQALLPPGLTVDTFDGAAYIGLIPFTMRDVRPVWSPSVPGLSHFHEVNVRTYVHRDGQNPGVWFFSLDAANSIAVRIARALWHLPYHFARMNLQRDGGTVRYSSERLWPAPTPGNCEIHWQPTGTPQAAEPGTLDFFLAERYLLYAFARQKLHCGQVYHTPYPLQSATLTHLDESLVSAAGLDAARSEGGQKNPLVHYAAGVQVEIFPLREIG
jgi:uncharacterized protein